MLDGRVDDNVCEGCGDPLGFTVGRIVGRQRLCATCATMRPVSSPPPYRKHPAPQTKAKCPFCHKMIRLTGLPEHIRVKHAHATHLREAHA